MTASALPLLTLSAICACALACMAVWTHRRIGQKRTPYPKQDAYSSYLERFGP